MIVSSRPAAATTAPPTVRRLAAVLAVALVLLAGLTAGGALRATAADEAPLATVTLTRLDPAVATPGGNLQVAGVVRGGRQRLRDVRVALRLSRTPVNSRAELAGVASGLTTGKDGDVIVDAPLPDLATNATADFSLSQPLRALDALAAFGVYVVSVEVTARHRTGQGRVAITRTFLPWVPRSREFQPTPVAWLWPLVGAPARQANGRYQDDTLATEMAPGGRLARLVAAGGQLAAQLPLTWAIDGDLVDSAVDLRGGYRVVGEPASVTQAGATSAGQWLAQVRTATAGHDLLPLPYGDPDLPALRRNGLAEDIGEATTTSASVLARALRRDTVTTDVAWPNDGIVNRPTLGVLRENGADAVVLAGGTQPTRLQLNYTPTGRSAVNTRAGALTSLVADSGLTELLADSDTPPLLAAQRFLAETAMITAELPSSGADRVVLVAPPTRWDPPQAFLDRLVAGVTEAPWIAGTSLDQMRAASPGEVERRGVRYPRSARKAELPASYLSAVRSQHARIDLFAKVLDPREPRRTSTVSNLNKSVLRLESTWWRTRSNERVNRISADQDHLAGRRGLLTKIAVQRGSYTLGSKSGSIPLTISNGTNRSIIVTLQLEPQNRRLRLSSVDQPIRIAPRRKVQVDVDATAVAAGPVVVDASLHTTDGSPLATAPVQLTIRVTQIGTVALIITLAAAGVLFLAAAVRLVRRALRARRTPPAPREVP